MRIDKTTATLLLGITLTFSQTPAQAYTGLYAFGDSLSDMGGSAASEMSLFNTLGFCDPAHPCPPYANGRISNGPVAIEYVAQALSIASVHGYAVAGSTSGVGNYIDGGNASSPGKGIQIPQVINIPPLPGMQQQLVRITRKPAVLPILTPCISSGVALTIYLQPAPTPRHKPPLMPHSISPALSVLWPEWARNTSWSPTCQTLA